MNETGPRKGSALDNALWPLKYANKNPDFDCKPLSMEGAKKMLRDFDEAFPMVGSITEGRYKMQYPQLQQIPRSK